MRKRYQEVSYDIVVVGGGMAGLCAAISAARHGANVALVHARPVLGGNASSEIRIHISGADQSLRQTDYAESGLLYELMLENKSRNDTFNYSIWDMVLFEAAKNEKNLTVYLNCPMFDCSVDGNIITSISCFQETTELTLKISAPLFVDATGNGTLGYFAGADYTQGSESNKEYGEPHAPDQPNNERMGNTILMKAVDTGHPVKYEPPAFAKKLTEHQLRYRVHSKTMKVDASMAPDPEEWLRLSACSCAAVDYGYWWLELMGDGDDIIPDYEKIRDDLMAYAYGLWDHIKNGGQHGAENFALEWVGALPGMRESRRLLGDYVLNECDILEHRQFDDAVAYGGWCVDLHAPHGLLDFDVLPSDCHHFTGVYTIPYRSYYSRNIRNLFLAGRDISTSKLGLASTRILGCCAVGGQAVGTAAALCVKYNVLPRELAPHIPEVQQLILKDDGFLPNILNQDEKDFARKATFTASSAKSNGMPQNVVNGVSRKLGDETNAWISDGLSNNGETLCMKFDAPHTISELRLTFDSNFAYPIRVTMSANRQAQQRIGVPPELVKDYTITAFRNGKAVYTKEIKDNHQRHNVVAIPPVECDAIEFRFTATNGATDVTVYEVRAY
ncbi:MAG: FAD-dependent oxidoreductase [Victivallales bacterium]|nr:FAD-dependent oxidoreductase [Victivallales bacterium]